MCLNVGGEGLTGSESLAVTAAQENTQARGPHTSHRLGTKRYSLHVFRIELKMHHKVHNSLFQ